MGIRDIAPGLHADVPSSTYLAREPGVVSKSILELVRRSPMHYKSWLDGAPEEDETPALSFGTDFHCALLEPSRFAITYAVEPDFGDCRKKDNKAERDAWRKANDGAKPLSANDDVAIRGMVSSVHAHHLAGRMIRDGQAELTVRWDDAETGLPCKSRADYYIKRHRMVADVKSTQDASPEAFRRDIVKYRYYWQDALYRAGFAAVGEAVEHFVFIAVEKSPPYAVGVYSLDAAGVALGHQQVRTNIRLLADCMAANQWPGYSTSIRTIELPPWAA